MRGRPPQGGRRSAEGAELAAHLWTYDLDIAHRKVVTNEHAGYADGGSFLEDRFEPGPELELYREIRRTDGQPLESRIGPLRPKVDLFFDKVLVNAPDPEIRRNRLALLHSLLQEFSTIADFSEIVTERQAP